MSEPSLPPIDPARQRMLVAGAALGGLGVMLGAFAAHALRAVLDEQALGWWQTAVQYQFWHALALIGLGAVPRRLGWAGALIGAGTLIFSGSLYALALTDLRVLGVVTPVGGVMLVTGWAVAVWRLARG